MATITLQGTQINTNGDLPSVGDNAPDFVLVNSDMEDVSLATYEGKKKLLSIVEDLLITLQLVDLTYLRVILIPM